LNRADFIGQTLDSIIGQATEEVEIVIVDGASTDNTPEVVREYQTRFPRINYVRLEKKGGIDQDYNLSVEHAQGRYCWLMSDDDIIKPGAIEAVLSAIRQDHDLIVVNAEVRSVDFSESIEPRRLVLTEDQHYSSGQTESLLKDVATYMTFIGCVVIRRSLWLERDKASYFGTEFIHVGVIFQSPLPGTALVIARPWIVIRAGNASWSSKYFQIWAFKWPTLIWSFPPYSDAAKNAVCPREPWRSPKILLTLRAKGVYSEKEYQKWLVEHPVTPQERLIIRGIAWLPGCLLNLFVWLYFKWRRPAEQFGISEFEDSPFHYTHCLRRWRGQLTGLWGR
jgi:glycosyltransferase involved in cell wall biosynthesis